MPRKQNRRGSSGTRQLFGGFRKLEGTNDKASWILVLDPLRRVISTHGITVDPLGSHDAEKLARELEVKCASVSFGYMFHWNPNVSFIWQCVSYVAASATKQTAWWQFNTAKKRRICRMPQVEIGLLPVMACACQHERHPHLSSIRHVRMQTNDMHFFIESVQHILREG